MSSGSHWNLPLALLDLAVAQTRQQLSPALLLRRPDASRCRGAHASALALKPKPKAAGPRPDVRGGYLRPPTAPVPVNARSSRLPSERQRRVPGVAARHGRVRSAAPSPSGPVALLQNRVEALMRQPVEETETPVEENAKEVELHYDDRELQTLYMDLLTHSVPEIGAREAGAPPVSLAPKDLLEGVVRRIGAASSSTRAEASTTSPSSMSFAARLAARQAQASLGTASGSAIESEESKQEQVPLLDVEKMHHSILLRVAEVVRAMESTRKVVGEVSTPVVLLTSQEWDALVGTCIEDGDLAAAEYALELVKRSGSAIPEKLLDDVAASYAKRGSVPGIVAFFNKFIGKPTERQRDLHIKAHLKSPDPEYDVNSALTVLHNYEALALLPPVQSYTRLISALFCVHSAQCSAQAWDLFAHMRYVAHPKPDAHLYALMIRACAGTGYWQSSYAAQPERALDLWTEMRQDAQHPPSIGAYNAIILACARSRDHTADAFRLAREMLDAHRDAFGNPLMRPDRATFAALLVAAKTRGDLARTRWILAEMLNLREREREGGEAAVAPDEKMMMHVFHAYTSYRPPFRRGKTKIVDEEPVMAEADGSSTKADSSTSEKAVEEVPLSKGRFGMTPPQTRAEVIAEAHSLFERILEDTGRGEPSQHGEILLASGAFSKVAINTPLLNSYLSVHYVHGSLEEARRLFRELFPRVGVERSLRTYVEALERCGGHNGDERERRLANAFAEEIWPACRKLENTLELRAGSARLIERAYAAMIRVFTLDGDLDRAMALVRAFATRYTPRAVSVPRAKPEMRSSRTILFAARPLVRLSTPSEVPDDGVPPLLTFRDLELLHHRLVVAGPACSADIDFVKYLCKAYEGALRKRRDLTIRS